jgi:hypothetical protein
MIAASERHETRAGDTCGQMPALIEWDACVVACVHHQGRYRHLPSIALTSVSPLARRLRTASAGEVEMRCSSLNQSACSLVPPGMNCDAKSWRNAGFS